PDGASCVFEREGKEISKISQTPGSAIIRKDKHDITVRCDKPGYAEATYINRSSVAGTTVGNVIAGGLVGWAVDSSTGADTQSDSAVNLPLVPQQATAPTEMNKPAASGASVPSS